MRALPRLTPMIMLIALVTACGARPRSTASSPPRTYVRVTNQSWMDMTIYVLRSSERVRIGTVNGNQTQRLTLPHNMVFGATPLRFMADPIGSSRTSQSFEITVSPGDEVTLTIPPSLD